MTAIAFRPRVGLASIGKGVDSTHADFTRSVREQMQGVIKEYTRFVEHLDEQGPDILRDALEPTFQMSQDIVPHKTGTLKNSGYLETDHTRGRTVVEMGYARGGNPDYAVIVHEDPDKFHPEPTQYKFLQQPLEQDMDNVQRRIFLGYRRASGLEMG